MKTVTTAIVILILIAVNPTNAYNYLWGMNVTSATNTNYGTAISYGVFSPTGTANQNWPTSNYAYAAILAGNNADGSKILLKKCFMPDYRNCNWLIQVWAGMDYASDTAYLRIWGSGAALPACPLSTLNQLCVIDPGGTNLKAGSQLIGSVINPLTTGGTQANPWWIAEIPIPKTANPEAPHNGLILGFTPEPSGILIMLSCIIAFTGVWTHSRKGIIR